MREQVCEQLTLSLEVFPASHFPWLESKREKKMTVTYGRKCSELSENLRRVGLSVRTYLESCDLPGERFVRTWSVRDTLSPYLILKLRLSERPTGESGSHLWQTPRANDAEKRGNFAPERRNGLPADVKLWPTPDVRGYTNEHSMEMLKAVAKDRDEWSGMAYRACSSKKERMWPTPRAQEYKDTLQSLPPSRIKDPGKDNLTQRVARERLFATPNASHAQGTSGGGQIRDLRTDAGGQLNLTFVEWLMGFPLGWTDLSA